MFELVPIIGIIFGTGGPVAIIIFIVIYQYKKRQLQGQEILAAIEKGIEVPFPPPRKRNYRNLGLIWSAVGIALFIGIWVSSKEMAGAIWGLLPLLVGVAFLLIGYLEKKDKESDKDT